MSIRDRLARGFVRTGYMMAGQPSPATDDFWWQSAPDRPYDVTPTSALKLSTVYACIRLWSYTIAMFPAFLMERFGLEDQGRAVNHPQYTLVHRQPNEYQTPFEFFQEAIGCLATRGNAYAEKIPGSSGLTEQLWPIHPDFLRVDWFNRKTGRRRVYDVSSGWDGRARVLRDDQIWHPRLGSLDGGLTGASPIRLCAESIGLAMSAQGAAQTIYRNGLKVPFQITTDKRLDDTEAASIQKRAMQRHAGWANWGKPLVLGSGASAKPVAISPDEAQLLESMHFGVADCARVWGVPLHLLQQESRDTSWGTGIQYLKLGFYTFTIQPVTSLVEQSLDQSLIIDRERYFFEFEMGALLRADMKTQYDSFRIALGANNPFMTRNEVRRLLNLNRDLGPDGDRFMVATNNTGISNQPPGANGKVPSNGTSMDALGDLLAEQEEHREAA